MTIADNKERLAITLDKDTVNQIKDIAEVETRTISNVIQILCDHGLRDRNKYRLGPTWCYQILNKHITFERPLPGSEQMGYARDDDDNEVEYVADCTIVLDIGIVLDVVEWKEAMHVIVEVDKRDALGGTTGEKELLFVAPEHIVKVIGDHGRMFFSRTSNKSALSGVETTMPPSQPLSPEPVPPPESSPSAPIKRKGRGKAKQSDK